MRGKFTSRKTKGKQLVTPQSGNEGINVAQKSYPDIYEVMAPDNHSVKVLSNGYYPIPSPDGKCIAFWGWSESAKNEKVDLQKSAAVKSSAMQAGLYIFNRTSKKRNFLQARLPDSLKWTPDSKELLTMDIQPIKSTDDASIVHSAHISAYNTASFRKREIATLQAKDFEPVNRTTVFPSLRLLSVSNDGNFVFVDVSEIVKKEKLFYTEKKTLEAVNLRTGKNTVVAEINNEAGRVIGWDWHDDSDPLKPAQ